jgi:hypothetical protein
MKGVGTGVEKSGTKRKRNAAREGGGGQRQKRRAGVRAGGQGTLLLDGCNRGPVGGEGQVRDWRVTVSTSRVAVGVGVWKEGRRGGEGGAVPDRW